MANLACIGSHTVNGVAELHSQLVQSNILKDFVDFYGVDKFRNVTNGSTSPSLLLSPLSIQHKHAHDDN